jgi:hypothetical protein
MVITIVIDPILRSSTANFPTIIPPVVPSKTRIFGAPVNTMMLLLAEPAYNQTICA